VEASGAVTLEYNWSTYVLSNSSASGYTLMTAPHAPTGDCTACPIGPDRRAFFHQTVATVGGILAAFGVSSEPAHALPALPVSLVSALQSRGSIHVYPIPDKDGVQIDKDNGIIVVRWLGSMYAFAIACPHQNTTLTWLDKEERFQCPKHRSQYSADGYFIRGRATRGMDRYAISRDPNKTTVTVDVAIVKKEDDDKDGWEAAAVNL
jgi:Rieske Fe-S protein